MHFFLENSKHFLWERDTVKTHPQQKGDSPSLGGDTPLTKPNSLDPWFFWSLVLCDRVIHTDALKQNVPESQAIDDKTATELNYYHWQLSKLHHFPRLLQSFGCQ